MARRTYEVPEGMTEETARENMGQLLLEIRAIEADLGDRTREETMDPQEYDSWRVRAKGAWGHLMDEYRALKLWSKDQQNATKGEASGSITAGIGLLRKGLDRVRGLEALYDVVVDYLREDTDATYAKVEEAVLALGGGEQINDRGDTSNGERRRAG